MNIRDWLAIIVIIFIVLILLDGFRRKWLERKNRIVMKLDKNTTPVDVEAVDEALVKSELPSGGARTVPRSDNTTNPENLPHTEEVPVLMESVNLNEVEIEEYSAGLESSEELADLMEEKEEEEEATPFEVDDGEDTWPEDDAEIINESESVENQASITSPESDSKTEHEERIEPTFGDQELTFSRDEQGELELEHHNLIDHDIDDEDNEDEPAPAEEVIIINVMAKADTALEGSKMLPVLLKFGLRLGDMSIFHRYADSDGKGPVMFSMANMLKPGTFSISEMESLATPGVSFFMQLPNKMGNMQCFEQMLKTAKAVEEELDAVLKDENRSVFTGQTIEHSRQRIRDFELEMLARK
ncbi:MAG: cell division protein ZipA [Gammaproteobacteria bacterium]|nr:cell division protein ZipA [Gammaproteobacteria bacterium]